MIACFVCECIYFYASVYACLCVCMCVYKYDEHKVPIHTCSYGEGVKLMKAFFSATSLRKRIHKHLSRSIASGLKATSLHASNIVPTLEALSCQYIYHGSLKLILVSFFASDTQQDDVPWLNSNQRGLFIRLVSFYPLKCFLSTPEDVYSSKYLFLYSICLSK